VAFGRALLGRIGALSPDDEESSFKCFHILTIKTSSLYKIHRMQFIRAASTHNRLPTPGCDATSTVSSATRTSFFRVCNQVYLAMFDARQAERLAQNSLKGKCIIVPAASAFKDDLDLDMKDDCFLPSSLIEIYKFNEMSNQISRRNADSKLVFSTGSTLKVQTRVSFLVGCYMMLSLGTDADETYEVFKNCDVFSFYNGLGHHNLLDCWRSVQSVISMGWIDFHDDLIGECDEELTINMEEFIHYSRYLHH
jgi:hypothetical protein